MICPNCKVVNPTNARFCTECGARLLAGAQPSEGAQAEVQPPEEQRRLVTILFADVSGFTAISESLDPEDVTQAINSLWSRLDSIILAHGGKIDKHMGDAIIALWGAEATHEDDPERAIQAAIEMQHSKDDDLSINLRMDASSSFILPPSALHMRVGIHTGPVFLTTVGSRGEYSAVGEPVSLAERLERDAPVGGILISYDTFRHVSGLFDVSPQRTLSVKGRLEPLQTYLVERARPQGLRLEARGVQGIETRMVGRDGELRRLQDAFKTVRGEHCLRMITIAGEAGIGKTRLMLEFGRWLDLQPGPAWHLSGRPSTESKIRPYALLRDLFSMHFELREIDSSQRTREKIKRRMAPVTAGQARLMEEEVEMRSAFVGQLLGFDYSDSPYLRDINGRPIDDPRQLRDRALIYMRDYLRQLAAQGPLVILLEDIHAADDSSLDMLDRLALSLAREPVLILCTARPALFERLPDWGQTQACQLRMELAPLSYIDSQALVSEILKKLEHAPAELRNRLASSAEGNPYFIEELIKMLIDEGVITASARQWQVDLSRIGELHLPSTLASVLQSRLDVLPKAEREVLQRAAVIGRTFWDKAVDNLGKGRNGKAGNGDGKAPSLPAVLHSLQEKEIIFQIDPPSFAGTQEYIFKHSLLRDAAYESVLKRQRKGYHQQAAAWLLAASGKRAAEFAGQIGGHFEQAGDFEQARGYLKAAGEYALRRFANMEAIEYFSRALALAPAYDWAYRWDLLLMREQAYDHLGQREAQKKDLQSLENLAGALDDLSCQAEAALRWSNYYFFTSNYQAVEGPAQTAIHLAGTAGNLTLQAEGYHWWARALLGQARHPEAKEKMEQSLALSRQAADDLRARRIEARTLYSMGGYYLISKGDYAQARDYYRQALEMAHQAGSLQDEASALNGLGVLCDYEGDFQQARKYLEQYLAISRQIGNRRGEGLALGNLGVISRYAADFEQAKKYSSESLAISRETGYRMGEISALENLGDVLRRQGEYEAAQEYILKALEISEIIDDPECIASCIISHATLAFGRGEYELAAEFSRRASQIADQAEDLYAHSVAQTRLGLALAALLKNSEAAEAFRQSLEIRRTLGNLGETMETLAGLSLVEQASGNAEQAQAYHRELLVGLDNETNLSKTEEPFLVYLLCYRTFMASQDPELHTRAEQLLDTACSQLQAQASRMDDAARRLYLQHVPWHREIIQRKAAAGD